MSVQRPINSQQGLSLIELMVAITLGIFLSFGAVEIYIGSDQAHRAQNALAQLQENARYALNVLSKDIRNSGYMGCAALGTDGVEIKTVADADSPIPPYTEDSVLNGAQSTGAQTWSPAKPADLGSIADNTDILTVAGVGRCRAPLASDMADGTSPVNVPNDNSCSFQKDEIVMISDCEQASIFRITNTPGSTGVLQHGAFDNQFYIVPDHHPEVMSLRFANYFIRNDDDGVPSLFVKDTSRNSNNPIALVEGVESMQLEYGVDTVGNGIPEFYAHANTVDGGATYDWSNVVSVKITLLLRTTENLNAGSYTFNAGGTNVTYTDGFMRKTFATTVQIRNRGLSQ